MRKKVAYLLQRTVLRIFCLKERTIGIIYGFFLKKVGQDFRVGKNVYISGMNNIEIGNNIHLNHNCYLAGMGGITIEDNVLFSPNVKIFSFTHNYHNKKTDIILQGFKCEPVKIGKGSWLCADAVILPGINIGVHSVIAAGSVVTKDVPNNCLVGGVPAKLIKKI